MPVPAWPLVGRDAERSVVDGALARLRRGHSCAVVVLGEPGIGKTRFLREVRRLARIGEVALTGSASEFGAALPYGAFVAALDDYVQTLDSRLLGTLDEQHHATLAGLLPSYPVAPSLSQPGSVDAQYQAHRSIRALLQCLASAKPHLVVLDDLHWADTATIATVSSLLRRPPIGPVLLLLGARLRQVPAGFLTAVEEARAAGHADRVDLAPLTASESRQLLDPGLPDDEAERLFAASGGNPFYLEQLARIPPAHRALRGDATLEERHGDLPPLVAAALTDELEALDETAHQFVQGAAVVGDPFDADLAQRTAELTVQAAVGAIDVLLDRDVVRRTDVPRRFAFRHPLLRRAVYETTPGGWQLAAHERCARELERRGASTLLLAGHVEHSGRHGDLHAVATLARAGELARTRSPLEAARFFAAALRLMPPGTDDERRIGLGAALSTAYAMGGRFAEAQLACRETLALLADDRSDRYLELESLCAFLDQALGNHREAHARLTHALARLPSDPTPHRVDLLTQLSIDGFYALDLTAMAAWSAQARADAGVLGDRVDEIRTAVLVALAAAIDGHVDAAHPAITDAARAADALEDGQIVEAPNLLSTLATAEYYLDRYAQANAHIERALTVARASGRGQYVPLLYWSGTIRAARGDLDQALEVLERAVEIARIIDYSVGVAWNLAAQSTILSDRGESARALDAARQACLRTAERSAALPAELARLAHASVLVDCGEPEQALAELDACAAGRGPAGLPPRWQPQVYELATRSHLALGRTTEAARILQDLRAAADAVDLPTTIGSAHRAAAAVALAASDPGLAEHHATAALDAFSAAGAVIEAEKARVLLARSHAAAGRAEHAIEQLTRAADRFESCSARGLRVVVDRELRKLGRRRPRGAVPRPREDGALSPLTPREREIAMLVAQGKTNPQIAEELFLSGKTVETHVGHSFQKLRVTSRLELARLVDRARDKGADGSAPGA